MTAHAQWPWLSLNEGSDIESDVIFERAIGPRLDILLFINCRKSSYENKRLSLLKVSYLLNTSSGTPKIKQPPRGLSDHILMLGCLEYIFYSFLTDSNWCLSSLLGQKYSIFSTRCLSGHPKLFLEWEKDTSHPSPSHCLLPLENVNSNHHADIIMTILLFLFYCS